MEAEEQAERERLRKQWLVEQDKIRSNSLISLCLFFFVIFEVRSFERNLYCGFSDEPLQITYSYWDGTGHRKVLQASKAYSKCFCFLFMVSLLILKLLIFLFSFIILFVTFQVRKGDKIGDFLRAVQQQLAPEFREVRTTSVENLLYVKEDLIIPHVRRI